MPPTVEVTIGRVEVRSYPPPVSRRRAASPGVLPLDEYLTRRGRGS
jgi:hypothetical protein